LFCFTHGARIFSRYVHAVGTRPAMTILGGNPSPTTAYPDAHGHRLTIAIWRRYIKDYGVWHYRIDPGRVDSCVPTISSAAISFRRPDHCRRDRLIKRSRWNIGCARYITSTTDAPCPGITVTTSIGTT